MEYKDSRQWASDFDVLSIAHGQLQTGERRRLVNTFKTLLTSDTILDILVSEQRKHFKHEYKMGKQVGQYIKPTADNGPISSTGRCKNKPQLCQKPSRMEVARKH